MLGQVRRVSSYESRTSYNEMSFYADDRFLHKLPCWHVLYLASWRMHGRGDSKGRAGCCKLHRLACDFPNEWRKAQSAIRQEFNTDFTFTLKALRALCCWTREGRVSRALLQG